MGPRRHRVERAHGSTSETRIRAPGDASHGPDRGEMTAPLRLRDDELTADQLDRSPGWKKPVAINRSYSTRHYRRVSKSE